ncbi:MAG: glutamine amidotransferase [Hyphomicrobiales bacterium]|nr:glutamine amidotransferase [Hyphomicrobiales bacterium]
MAQIIVVEHRDYPAPDRGQTHLAARGFEVRRVGPFRGEALPQVGEGTAGVLIMGGPQFVTHLDEAPYLRDEMAFAGRVMAAGVPLLGICLGAQLIAALHGARVAAHPQGKVAFGYYPVHPTAAGRGMVPEGLEVPAGNIQGFDLPPGAELLAGGEIFPHQAYRLGARTCGFQFHPEVTRPILDQWQRTMAAQYGRPGAQTRAQQDAGFARYDAALHAWYTGFLDRFFGAP